MRPHTSDAVAKAASTTTDDRDRRILDRTLTTGVRPDAVDVLRPATGGRAGRVGRVEGARSRGGSARACVGGATPVGALRPAVADVVAGSARISCHSGHTARSSGTVRPA